MSSFFYKYIAVQSLVRGKKTALYFSRLIFKIYRSLPILLKLAATSFRFFQLFYTSCYSLIHLKFWFLTLSHFIVFYQSIYTLRIIMEYGNINPMQSNSILKIIYELSEPYFKLVQAIFPKGLIANILGICLFWQLSPLVKDLARAVTKYQNGGNNLREVNLLLNAAFDETIVFN